jgi:hypothetical protein
MERECSSVWLIGTGITPHIRMWDESKRDDGRFSRSEFIFDQENNESDAQWQGAARFAHLPTPLLPLAPPIEDRAGLMHPAGRPHLEPLPLFAGLLELRRARNGA